MESSQSHTHTNFSTLYPNLKLHTNTYSLFKILQKKKILKRHYKN